eukprot:sb/3471829/
MVREETLICTSKFQEPLKYTVLTRIKSDRAVSWRTLSNIPLVFSRRKLPIVFHALMGSRNDSPRDMCYVITWEILVPDWLITSHVPLITSSYLSFTCVDRFLSHAQLIDVLHKSLSLSPFLVSLSLSLYLLSQFLSISLSISLKFTTQHISVKYVLLCAGLRFMLQSGFYIALTCTP